MKEAKDFLEICANKHLNIVLTFPSNKSSNGLGSEDFISLGKSLFESVMVEKVETNFSTLGGNKIHRNPRSLCEESIIIMRS